MSTSGLNDQASPCGEPLSKRELMKFNRLLKIIDSQENSEAKSCKRRTGGEARGGEGPPRKRVKPNRPAGELESVNSEDRNREITVSTPENASEESRQTVKLPAAPPKKHLTYNPRHEVPNGEAYLFDYILSYSYKEKEKIYSKQEKDWTHFENIGCRDLKILEEGESKSTIRRLSERFEQTKQQIDSPFSKPFL